MKTSVRRGLFHPNDIKTVGLAPASPGTKSAPLPDVNALGHFRAQSHPVTPVAPLSASPFTAPLHHARSHSRSPSFAGSSSGSFGKSDARRLANQEFNKYTEDDDEDYDDVFGKPNGSCACLLMLYFGICDALSLPLANLPTARRGLADYSSRLRSTGTPRADVAAQHAVIKQVLGTFKLWLPADSLAMSY